jgi:hypothetical protein
MKTLVITLFILTSLNSFASKPIKIGKCNLFTANFDTKKEFTDLFDKLKEASKTKNKKQIIKLIRYPLSTKVGGKRVSLKNEAEVKKYYSQIFDETFFSAIDSQDINKLFCNYQGVMLGGGEIWLGKHKDKSGIKTVNN